MTYRHIYLSPHLDDVVLSCGGHIWQQVHAGEQVLVVTVFAGSPPPFLSDFAAEMHRRWQLPADAPAIRREEDIAALNLLGARFQHWPYTDCIYRHTVEGHFPYSSEEALFGAIHPAEETLIAGLARRILALPLTHEGLLYVPLGVGGHVDHRIVRQAAERSGCHLQYYEDYPYVERERALLSVLAGRLWRAILFPLSDEALAAKVAAIACYTSQLGLLGDSPAAAAARVQEFARRTGGDILAERYWSAPSLPGCAQPVVAQGTDGQR
ncbi:MAG: PIG-L family deacetylase [Anaerolineae bacterium]|nr:PIG-L family deacetylase [Anaerolineae bacterium]